MSVRNAAIWAMSAQYAAFTINFAASIYLARTFIGPDELGLFSIAFAATTLIAVLQDFGLTRYVAGEAELDEGKLRTVFSLSLVIAWTIALIAMALAWPMAALYAMPGLMPVMLVIGASYLVVPFAIVPTALRQRALARRSGQREAMLTSVTGQEILAEVGLVRDFRIGTVTLGNVGIAYAASPAFVRLKLDRRPALLLGMRELRAFRRVAIDFASRKVLFDLPPEF